MIGEATAKQKGVLHMVWSIGLLAVLIGLDQALKYWTVTHLALGRAQS